jgi:hypothetical protein
MSNGFIKLSRGFFDHSLWTEKRKHSRAEAFIDLIQNANYAPKKVMISGAMIQLGRGEQVASLRFLSTRWGWSTSKVSKFLDLLESDEMITRKTKHKQTTLTLCNYETYNSAPNGNQTAIKQQSNSDQTKQKKDKNEKKERVIFVKPTADQILEFGKTLDPAFTEAHKFIDYYESNGWKVGRNPMRDWKCTVRNWHRKRHGESENTPKEGTRRDGMMFAAGKWRKVQQ